LQQEYLPSQPDNKIKRILGVIIPTIEEATKISKNKKIGIIGTKATINSKVYEVELNKREKSCQIFSQACPLLVPFIEENWQARPEFKRILKKYLQPLKIKQIDVLILGCTHYALALPQIKEAIGRRVKIIDPAITAAAKLKDYLERHPEIENRLSKKGEIILTTTDDKQQLKDIGQKMIAGDIKEVKKIELK
jgi:glutamate racemase